MYVMHMCMMTCMSLSVYYNDEGIMGNRLADEYEGANKVSPWQERAEPSYFELILHATAQSHEEVQKQAYCCPSTPASLRHSPNPCLRRP